jgi:hypothetical protein
MLLGETRFPTKVKTTILLLRVVTPYRLEGRYFSPEDRDYVSTKRLYLPTSLHGVTTQNNIVTKRFI